MKNSALTISVITPSYNQAAFLPACLRSVAEQSYSPLEHLVYDPGSSDGSREVVAQFAHATLIAEPDHGQSDAINKGWKTVQGDILAWVNSDDAFYDETVFEQVIARFEEADAPDIVYGKGIFVNESGEYLRDAYVNPQPETLPWRLQQETGILQPAVFIRRSVVERVGLLEEELHFCMDYEYWIRCVKAGIRFVFMDTYLAKAAYHINNKTYGMRGESYRQVCSMLQGHFGYANHNWLRRYAEFRQEGFDGVLAHSGNTAVASAGDVEADYRLLMDAYNGGFEARKLLESKSGEKGWGDTLREMKGLDLECGTPCHPIPLDQPTEPYSVCYTVGPKRWAYDASWKKAQIEQSHTFLHQQIAERKRDVCVVVGNGPSLKKTDLSLLKDVDVIYSNNAFLNEDLLRYGTYYTVVNYLVAEQSAPYINQLTGVAKVLPYWLSYCLNAGEDIWFMDAVGYPEFSTDMFKNMSWRHTVSFFNLHLAYGLGFKRVVLIGFDNNYVQQADVKEGEVIVQTEDDVNHFDASYFKGYKWQAADTDNMAKMYALAKEAYEANGREIVNATVGGKLELFPRMELEEALRGL